MQNGQLGNGGPEVGRIGLGCMSFGGMYGPTNRSESFATLARAFDLGVTHLDVANIYGGGVCEEVIGAFLKETPRDFVIATKAGIVTGSPRRYDNSPAYLRAELEGSLRRLGVDHVALYYVHRRDPDVPVEDVMETLLRFRDEGKIGAIGFSEIAPATLERACACGPVAAVQSEYSLWTRQPELGLIQACDRLGVAFVSFSPLGRGIFADSFPAIEDFRDGDFRKTNPRFMEPNFSANTARIAKLRDWAHARALPLPTLALAWTLAKARGSIAIPGTRSIAHLEQCAHAADVRLSSDDLARIEEILPVGFAHGARYGGRHPAGTEEYC